MTNKLPEVGKRYKNISFKTDHKVLQLYPSIIVEGYTESLEPHEFWSFYEEIPDQDLNRSNNTQLEDDHFADVGKTIKENRKTRTTN